jgi:hypothetical protein
MWRNCEGVSGWGGETMLVLCRSCRSQPHIQSADAVTGLHWDWVEVTGRAFGFGPP